MIKPYAVVAETPITPPTAGARYGATIKTIERLAASGLDPSAFRLFWVKTVIATTVLHLIGSTTDSVT
jgi:hypothetical protein